MSINIEPFGITKDGCTAALYQMTNASGAQVSVTNFGAHLLSVLVPGRNGEMKDVCLGYDSLSSYESNSSYIGATVGRYCNRIGGGAFTLNGKRYSLYLNDGENTLHGGKDGFNKKMWAAKTLSDEHEDAVILSYFSPDMEEGFPGNLRAQVTFAWDDDCRLTIRYRAVCDQDTAINLTNHAYFNLEGEGDILDHAVMIPSDQYTQTRTDLIPTGRLLPVDLTPFDLREPKTVRAGLAMRGGCKALDAADGYDLNFVNLRADGKAPCAEVTAPRSGRVMRVYSDQRGVQFYTGQGLNVMGKGGVFYNAYAGLAIETQHYPDSVNQPSFPSTCLKAGETFESKTVYEFTVV